MSFDKEKYVNKTQYPSKRDFVQFRVMNLDGGVHGFYTPDELLREDTSWYEVGNKLISKTFVDGGIASGTCGNKIIVAVFNKEKYEAARKQYNLEEANINQQFYIDCCEDHGYDPESRVAKIIFDKAYDDGHSSGLETVYNTFNDLSDFAEDIIKAQNI